MLTGSRSALGPMLAAALIALAFAPGGPASARQEGRDQDRDRDTQSRHELQQLQRIPLVLRGGGRADISELVVIRSRFITISRTRFGVDVESLDKVDLGEVPLLSSLFGDALRAEDLNEDNRVGAVYGTGGGTLAAFIDDDAAAEGAEVSVVNGKYRYTLARAPEATDPAAVDLGDLGALTSVQQAVAGEAPAATTLVLRGLTTTTVPQVDGKVPVLSDIPGLQALFRGTVHERDKELIFFVRPSIIAGDEE